MAKFNLMSKWLKPAQVEVNPEGEPLLLVLGSLRDCTLKDAWAFARGLGEKFVTAPRLGRLNVREDKARNRFLFEIHEGGPSVSILDGVMRALEEGRKLRIPLSTGGFVEVEDLNGELFTLVTREKPLTELGWSQAERMAHYTSTINLAGKDKLVELFPESKKLAVMGGIILAGACAVFLAAGTGLVVVSSGALEVDAAMAQARAGYASSEKDNPAWQMDKAKEDSARTGQQVTALRKGVKGWTVELNDGSAPKSTNSGSISLGSNVKEKGAAEPVMDGLTAPRPPSSLANEQPSKSLIERDADTPVTENVPSQKGEK